MKIRLAEKDDAQDIADIIKRHAQTDYMGYATFDKKYVEDKMKKDFFLVATDSLRSSSQPNIIGCTRLSIVDLDLAEIRTLCVDEAYRGKGIATQLMEKSLEILHDRKMRKIVSRTKADNAGAIRLFEKFGFEKEGYFREHYRRGIDIIQLAKFL